MDRVECPFCGGKEPTGSRFCGQCGKKIAPTFIVDPAKNPSAPRRRKKPPIASTPSGGAAPAQAPPPEAATPPALPPEPEIGAASPSDLPPEPAVEAEPAEPIPAPDEEASGGDAVEAPGEGTPASSPSDEPTIEEISPASEDEEPTSKEDPPIRAEQAATDEDAPPASEEAPADPKDKAATQAPGVLRSGDQVVPGLRFGGRRNDRFEVGEEVGRGAQAVVYRVTDTRLGRTVAMKLCTAPEGRQQQMFVERFEREMKLTSRVNHPHVLHIFDCGELEDGTPYVFLEWMPYGSLADLVRTIRAEQAHVPLEWVLYYARATAAALRATHAADIVHRDIKPDNILVGKGGVAKVTDFGIARDISPDAMPMTEAGQTLGTVGFMAPEQVTGRPGPQSDIFSLGVTTFAMLTGRLPTQKRINSIHTGIIERAAWKAIPSAFVPVLKKMTAPKLSKRFPNCEAVLNALGRVRLKEDDRPKISRTDLPPLPSRAFVSGVTVAVTTPNLEDFDGDDGDWPFSSPDAQTPPDDLRAGAEPPSETLLGGRPSRATRSQGVPSGAMSTMDIVESDWQEFERSRNRKFGLWIAGGALLLLLAGLSGFQVLAAPCGNGLRGVAEDCDDGNAINEDGCVNTCEVARCGDGIVRGDLEAGMPGAEDCDDANQHNWDLCTNECTSNLVFLSGVGEGGFEWTMGAERPFEGGTEEHRLRSEKLEMPATPILMSPFHILRTEVTQAAYQKFIEETGHRAPKGNWDPVGQADHPVGAVSRQDAAAFCKWVGGSLPTEAQWEYAARSGGKDIEYPWGDDQPTEELAVLGDHRFSRGESWPVCSKPKGNTEQGLCDMAGNVWEHVQDDYYEYLGPKDSVPRWHGAGPVTNNSGKTILRGGGFWSTHSYWFRARARYAYDKHPMPHQGFRCAWPARMNRGTSQPGRPR